MVGLPEKTLKRDATRRLRFVVYIYISLHIYIYIDLFISLPRYIYIYREIDEKKAAKIALTSTRCDTVVYIRRLHDIVSHCAEISFTLTAFSLYIYNIEHNVVAELLRYDIYIYMLTFFFFI